jgi:hypothetical protein
MAYDRQIADRVSFAYYEGGHMMYIRPSAHAALNKDTASYIQRAAGPRVGRSDLARGET